MKSIYYYFSKIWFFSGYLDFDHWISHLCLFHQKFDHSRWALAWNISIFHTILAILLVRMVCCLIYSSILDQIAEYQKWDPLAEVLIQQHRYSSEFFISLILLILFGMAMHWHFYLNSTLKTWNSLNRVILENYRSFIETNFEWVKKFKLPPIVKHWFPSFIVKCAEQMNPKLNLVLWHGYDSENCYRIKFRNKLNQFSLMPRRVRSQLVLVSHLVNSLYTQAKGIFCKYIEIEIQIS